MELLYKAFKPNFNQNLMNFYNLAKNIEEHKSTKGNFIQREGEKSDYFYVLLSGEVIFKKKFISENFVKELSKITVPEFNKLNKLIRKSKKKGFNQFEYYKTNGNLIEKAQDFYTGIEITHKGLLKKFEHLNFYDEKEIFRLDDMNQIFEENLFSKDFVTTYLEQLKVLTGTKNVQYDNKYAIQTKDAVLRNFSTILMNKLLNEESIKSDYTVIVNSMEVKYLKIRKNDIKSLFPERFMVEIYQQFYKKQNLRKSIFNDFGIDIIEKHSNEFISNQDHEVLDLLKSKQIVKKFSDTKIRFDNIGFQKKLEDFGEKSDFDNYMIDRKNVFNELLKDEQSIQDEREEMAISRSENSDMDLPLEVFVFNDEKKFKKRTIKNDQYLVTKNNTASCKNLVGLGNSISLNPRFQAIRNALTSSNTNIVEFENQKKTERMEINLINFSERNNAKLIETKTYISEKPSYSDRFDLKKSSSAGFYEQPISPNHMIMEKNHIKRTNQLKMMRSHNSVSTGFFKSSKPPSKISNTRTMVNSINHIPQSPIKETIPTKISVRNTKQSDHETFDQKQQKIKRNSNLDKEQFKKLQRMYHMKNTTDRCKQKVDVKTAKMGFLIRGPWNINDLSEKHDKKSRHLKGSKSINVSSKIPTSFNSMKITKDSFFRKNKVYDPQNISKEILSRSHSKSNDKIDDLDNINEDLIHIRNMESQVSDLGRPKNDLFGNRKLTKSKTYRNIMSNCATIYTENDNGASQRSNFSEELLNIKSARPLAKRNFKQKVLQFDNNDMRTPTQLTSNHIMSNRKQSNETHGFYSYAYDNNSKISNNIMIENSIPKSNIDFSSKRDGSSGFRKGLKNWKKNESNIQSSDMNVRNFKVKNIHLNGKFYTSDFELRDKYRKLLGQNPNLIRNKLLLKALPKNE